MSENYIIDDDTIIRIDTKTKNFETDVLKNTTLIKGEHQSERLTFCMNRFVENKDLLECDKIRIHYINVGSSNNSSKGVYTVTDATQTSTDEIQFSWLISQNVTLYSGIVRFVIKFTNVDDDNKITYLWSTNINKDLSVSDGLDCDGVVDEEYIDILAQWEESIREDMNSEITKASPYVIKSEYRIDYNDDWEEEYKLLTSNDYDSIRELTVAGRPLVLELTQQGTGAVTRINDYSLEYNRIKFYYADAINIIEFTLTYKNEWHVRLNGFVSPRDINIIDNQIALIEGQLGTIDEALDGIIEIQNTLIGGESA
jgi:hypothetical protein